MNKVALDHEKSVIILAPRCEFQLKVHTKRSLSASKQ